MKILIVHETDWLKNNPTQPIHLAEKLSLRGHEIHAIDFELYWNTEKWELFPRKQIFDKVSKLYKGANISLIRPGICKLPVFDKFSLLFSHTIEINNQIKEFNPDIIIGFGILNAYIAMKLARKHNIPFIYYWVEVLHTMLPFRPYQPIAKFIERLTLKSAKCVVTINDELKDYTIEMGSKYEQTYVVRAGVDFERFKLNNDGLDIRKLYGIEKEDFVIIFVGRLYNFSGLKEVALELVKTKNKKTKLLIVGDGELYSELKHIKEEYKLEQLILTGQQPYAKIPAFIAASDVCILPSYNNRITRHIVPIKLYEYMAMGKPVIATELPGVVKEFGHDNGMIYVKSPENVISKALELSEAEILLYLGENARGFVEKYSWDDITDIFEEILKDNIIK